MIGIGIAGAVGFLPHRAGGAKPRVVYQLMNPSENRNTPKSGQSYTNFGVLMSRDSINNITLKGTATASSSTTCPSYYTRTQGHKYLIGGFGDNVPGHYSNGSAYKVFENGSTIYTATASTTGAYVSAVISEGKVYDAIIRPFIIDLTATFADKGQDFIDGLDTADKVAQALGYGSYAEMPYFDFNPAPDAQLALANAVMSLDFYDAEPEPEYLDDLNF